MERIFKTSLLILFILTTNCTFYKVQVNGYLDNERFSQFPVYASIFVVDDPKANNPLLHKEVRAKIEKLLVSKRYSITSFDNADLYLLFGCGIGSGRHVSGVMPIYRSGGTATAYTYGAAGWSYSTIQLPGSTQYVPYSYTKYDRWLTIHDVDGKNYRNTGEVKSIWIGEVASSGRKSDLREVIDYLLIPTIEHLGENTGTAVKVRLYSGDSRVKDLYK